MKRSLGTFAIAALVCGCASQRVDHDHTLIPIEAVVVGYGEDHIVAHGDAFEVLIDQTIPAVDLEVKIPDGPFDRRLTVYSDRPLPDDHLLRQVGAVVEFMAERRFLVALLSDPKEEHDTAFLYVSSLVGLKKKAAEPDATDNPDDAQRLREDH